MNWHGQLFPDGSLRLANRGNGRRRCFSGNAPSKFTKKAKVTFTRSKLEECYNEKLSIKAVKNDRVYFERTNRLLGDFFNADFGDWI